MQKKEETSVSSVHEQMLNNRKYNKDTPPATFESKTPVPAHAPDVFGSIRITVNPDHAIESSPSSLKLAFATRDDEMCTLSEKGSSCTGINNID